MTAERLLMTGGVRVLGDGGEIVGYVLTQDIEGGQLQRWILRGFGKVYTLEPWSAALTLEAWEAMVTTKAPQGDEPWGAAPEEGLWAAGAYYVVAQSKMVLLSRGEGGKLYGPLPEATFPRSEEVRLHAPLRVAPPRTTDPAGAQSGAGAPLGVQAPLSPPMPQLGVGDHTVSRVGLEGRAYSDAVFEAHANETFWKATEYFLLYPGYLRAGKPEAAATRIVPGELGLKDADGFHGMVLDTYAVGYRYEVTGCNYYHDEGPPPSWFV